MGLKGPTMCTREGTMAGAGSWKTWEEGQGERQSAEARFPSTGICRLSVKKMEQVTFIHENVCSFILVLSHLSIVGY